MIATGTDDPDEASEIKNANRASSAIGQLPEDRQREIYRPEAFRAADTSCA